MYHDYQSIYIIFDQPLHKRLAGLTLRKKATTPVAEASPPVVTYNVCAKYLLPCVVDT